LGRQQIHLHLLDLPILREKGFRFDQHLSRIGEPPLSIQVLGEAEPAGRWSVPSLNAFPEEFLAFG
jgi:hypothetical protein